MPFRGVWNISVYYGGDLPEYSLESRIRIVQIQGSRIDIKVRVSWVFLRNFYRAIGFCDKPFNIIQFFADSTCKNEIPLDHTSTASISIALRMDDVQA